MKNLVKALIQVMKDIPGIEKNTTVGTGQNSYQGVSDKDVKESVRKAMISNGLIIVPVDIEDNVRIERWEEEREWNGKKSIQQKQSVFTTVKTTYKLIHESGEELQVVGYGHGVDSQDKGAGKATTYALKYALLYLGLIPTGAIDDADNTHSEEIQTAKVSGRVISKSEAYKMLETSQSIDQLTAAFTSLPKSLQTDKDVIKKASEIKAQWTS